MPTTTSTAQIATSAAVESCTIRRGASSCAGCPTTGEASLVSVTVTPQIVRSGRDDPKRGCVVAWLLCPQARVRGGDVARYLLTRIAALVGIVWIVTIFCFLLTHMLPGDPSQSILRFSWTPKTGRIWDQQHGFTGPLLHQYWYWLRHALSGNLGRSAGGATVASFITSGYKVDLE